MDKAAAIRHKRADSVSPTARLKSLIKREIRDHARRLYRPLANALLRYPSPVVIDRERLQALCRRQGMLHYYDRSEVVELSIPGPIGDSKAAMTQRAGEHLIHAPFVGELPAVTLVGRYPLPIHGHRVVLEAIGRRDIALLNALYSITRGGPIGRTDTRRTLDHATLLYHSWSRGYFHWVTETLTRLEGLERYHDRTGRRPTLVLGPDPPRFQTESLALLGYDESDWVEWDGTTTTIDHFVVPSMRRGTDRSSRVGPVPQEWLRTRLREAIAGRVDPDQFSSRVYISRADADRRRVVNEADVTGMLSEYGFESYRLAEMSVAENVALFANAEFVVAPHGAGLTNLLFAENATVIELLREKNSTTYFELAQGWGHQYRYLKCEPQGLDYVVDTDALRDAVVEGLETDCTEN
jgi:hypothetical protein